MKTVIIYNSVVDPIRFYVVEGDFSHLNNVFVNDSEGDETLEDALNSLVFDADWNYLPSMESFPVDAVKEGAIVIVAGFLP